MLRTTNEAQCHRRIFSVFVWKCDDWLEGYQKRRAFVCDCFNAAGFVSSVVRESPESAVARTSQFA